MAMKVELFVPPEFQYSRLNIGQLNDLTGKQYHYASRGRHAIGHIIDSLFLKNKTVLVSPYMCDSVFKKLKEMGMQIKYYDIDPKDLNPSAISIEKRIEETKAGMVIAASMYGNPADMEGIEKICRKRDVYLIDDAAQSYGARINGKFIGTFGEGGLFAFSPGKATAGHMGALYWSRSDYNFKRTHHYLAHKVAWWDFKCNRLEAYKRSETEKYLASKMNHIVQKVSKIENDDIERFELEILGGILKAQDDGTMDFRKSIHSVFCRRYSNNGFFRIIENSLSDS